MFPADWHRITPDVPVNEMTDAGLLPAPEGETPTHPALRALELARLITGVHITLELLNGRPQWAQMPATVRPGP